MLILAWFLKQKSTIKIRRLEGFILGLGKGQKHEMSWFQKCLIFLANIENVVLLRWHLDGAALHFHSKTIRRVQKLAAREALWRRLFAHVLGNVDMLVLGSVQV